MKEEVLKIINNLIDKDKIAELYEKREENIVYPIQNNKINFKVLSDFNEQYFKQYEQLLIENAIIYTLKNKDENKYYLEFINNNINNLNEKINENIMIKIKTTELAFYNLVNKDDKIDNQIKNKYNDLFEKINTFYISLNSISLLYRSIIMDFIDVGDEMNKDKFLDMVFYTNNFDKYLINCGIGILNDNNIELYKRILIRLILSDNYLFLETLQMEEELDNHLKEIEIEYRVSDIDEDFFEDTNSNDIFKEINISILNYIKNNIELNKFVLPQENELRHQIYNNFITYNEYMNEREFDFYTIKDSEEKVLNLKKINPLYKLDFIEKYGK